MILLPPSIKSCSLQSGSGNTFLVVTGVDSFLDIPALCRKFACDGIVSYHEQKMRIFNLDGSEAQMCGNGFCSLVAHLWDIGDRRPYYDISTLAGYYRGLYHNDGIQIFFPKPLPAKIVALQGKIFACMDTGVPHAVFEGSLDELAQLGPKIMYDPFFGPTGSNITAYERINDTTVRAGTFERGVNTITGACGTGCMAIAFCLNLPQLTLIAPSNEKLIATTNPPSLKGTVAKKATLSILDLL
jgi:diaminopimelate epimerase